MCVAAAAEMFGLVGLARVRIGQLPVCGVGVAVGTVFAWASVPGEVCLFDEL